MKQFLVNVKRFYQLLYLIALRTLLLKFITCSNVTYTHIQHKLNVTQAQIQHKLNVT